MILKTLQPKRKEILPVSSKFVISKENANKRIEDKPGLNPLLNKLDDLSNKNKFLPSKDA